VAGIALAAYVSVGLLLVGGITLLPWGMAWLYAPPAPWVAASHAAPAAPGARAPHARHGRHCGGRRGGQLSLAVALTVMVASFRGSVTQWLDAVLPSPLYVRSALSAAGGESALLPPGVRRSRGAVARRGPRATAAHRPLQLDAARPALTLMSRPLGSDPAARAAAGGEALPVPEGQIGIWVSEAVVDLYGLRPGHGVAPLSAGLLAL
jgi:putative ABC transport system permease protein